MRETIERHLSALGDYRLDDRGLCNIVYRQDVDLTIEAGDGIACFHAELMHVGNGAREQVFERSLQLNMLMAGEVGCKLAYLSMTDSIVLISAHRNPDMTYDEFAGALTAFGDNVISFRSQIGRFAQPDPAFGPETDRLSPSDLIIRA